PYVRTWARGVTTTYSYNTARELTGKNYSDVTPDITGITYNRRGQLTNVTDGTGARILYYDTYGFQWAEQLPNYQNGRVLYYQRDGYGRRTQVGIYAQPDWSNHPEFLQSY